MGDRFDPKSTDAMFATILAEQRMFREDVMARFDRQDRELLAIKEQAAHEAKRTDNLERNERDRAVRTGTLATVSSALGGLVVWLADKWWRT